jgi:hypothetical protein
MRKFSAVYKEKQQISESILEKKVLGEFKKVYSSLLEGYGVSEFHDMDDKTQIAFLRELNEYWTEEDGLSKKGKIFLKNKSLMLTESSTELQKSNYLQKRVFSVISETFRQTDLKRNIYSVLDEMYKKTEAKDLKDVLPADTISGIILESFGKSLENLMTEIVYEITPEEELKKKTRKKKK